MVATPCFWILLPIRTESKPLAAIGEFPSAVDKLMIGKTLATNGEVITNAMIRMMYWQFIGNH